MARCVGLKTWLSVLRDMAGHVGPCRTMSHPLLVDGAQIADDLGNRMWSNAPFITGRAGQPLRIKGATLAKPLDMTMGARDTGCS